MSCNGSTASLWVVFLVLVVPRCTPKPAGMQRSLGPKKPLKLEQVLQYQASAGTNVELWLDLSLRIWLGQVQFA